MTAIRTVSSILSLRAARGIAGQPAELMLADQHVEEQHRQAIRVFADQPAILLMPRDPGGDDAIGD